MTKQLQIRIPKRGLRLSYRDEEFLDSDDARPLRILAEYIRPLQAFQRQRIQDTVVFFGSARLRKGGPFGHYYADAQELARLVTEWSIATQRKSNRLVVCSGGGGGIMEAANRGAVQAGGQTIGLNIGLPHEQRPNRYVTEDLCFEFHYFFMRKLWFAHLARALVIFPGGFGTMDELFEMLTLSQTRKLDRPIFILLYGSSYWHNVINFDMLVKHEMISPGDLQLFQFANDPQEALAKLRAGITAEIEGAVPSFAKSITSRNRRFRSRRRL